MSDTDLTRARAQREMTPPRPGRPPLDPFASGAKPSNPMNPKDALGVKKFPLSTVSAPVLAEVGVGMLEGAMKYGRHNYRSIGVRSSIYYDATMRHLMSWWEGEDIDPDSGLSHITKAICSLVVLRDAMIQHKLNDDRPPRAPAGWMHGMNEHVKNLIVKYPTPVAPYTEIDQSWITATVNGGDNG